MSTKPTLRKSVNPGFNSLTPGSTAISPEAMQAWERIPQHEKTAIIEAIERPSPPGSIDTKTIEVGPTLLTVRTMSSGFRVVYEPGNGRNTIVSVITPREAQFL
jgi:hypothetical protein